MTTPLNIVFFAFGLLFLYAIGVFALYVQAGENKLSAAIAASGWWLAFSVSQYLCYLAVTMH